MQEAKDAFKWHMLGQGFGECLEHLIPIVRVDGIPNFLGIRVVLGDATRQYPIVAIGKNYMSVFGHENAKWGMIDNSTVFGFRG